MSSALAIGAVSAVLKNLLDNGIVEQVALGTTVNVSAVAPDTIRLDAPEDPPQLNVFLHQVTPNAAWRNRELPSRASNGDRLTNPPLALSSVARSKASRRPPSCPRDCPPTCYCAVPTSLRPSSA